MQLISVPAVAARLGIHRATIYRWIEANPSFPRPFKLSPRRVMFDAAEVDSFIRACRGVA